MRQQNSGTLGVAPGGGSIRALRGLGPALNGASIAILGLATSLGGASGQELCSAWRLEETLRIGALDGDQALSDVLDLDVGPDGSVYVAQIFTPHVAVYSSSGDLVRRIGRAGGGPGEFDGWPSRLGFIGDTLWVKDRSDVRLIDSTGRETRRIQFSHSMAEEGSRFRPGTPLADGTFLGTRVLVGDIPAFYTADRLSLPRFESDGTLASIVAHISQPMRVPLSDGVFATHPLASWNGESWVPVVVTADATAVVFVQNIRTESPASFELVKKGLDGQRLMVRRIPYEPRLVSSSDEDWLREVFGNWLAGDYNPRPSAFLSEATLERRRLEGSRAMPVPRHYPPVRELVAGKDSTIWVLRELTPPDLADHWEVYGPDGDLEGSVTIRDGRSSRVPWFPRLKIFQATRDEVWGATIDEFDVPYIHRYRVRRGCN